MRQLIFYKKFDNISNANEYIFKLVTEIPNVALIYNFGVVPDEFHINVLNRTITDLFMSNVATKWEGESESFDDINEIKFISDLKSNENFDIFILQIIEKITNIIKSDFK